ncbi:MAG TPA: serine hydrolase domain-containing protein [Planctomycetota bacterium]|nr:serine hydrolase domain-containing protein [Planctomycetota bacterium]
MGREATKARRSFSSPSCFRAAVVVLGLSACAPPPAPESALDRLVPSILDQDRIPSAVVVAGTVDAITYRRAFGQARLDTVYDLASLTKVVATTSVAMKLVEEGRLSLRDPVSRHVAAFAGRDVTIEDLLTHRSGLPAYLTPSPGQTPDEILAASARLAGPKVYRYSCLNMIALARAAEEVAGRPLAELARTLVFEPLGMRDTGFAPDPARCAPTAHDVPPGVVHDPLARAYGGPQRTPGNAGLFSTADDLAVFCRALLGGRLFKPETVRRMWTPDADTRGLGWDVFDDPPYRPGVGHTGFTGTLLWIDPERGRFAVVLANRTFHGEKVDVRRLRRDVLSALNQGL